MREEERRKDEELAAFTDALLEGRAESEGSERPPLADVVELLAQTLSPQPTPEELRRKLRRRIAAEWRRLHAPARQRLTWPLGWPTKRWVGAAATALILVAIAAALLVPESGANITGAVVGKAGAIVLALALVLIALWLLSRR
ncbi:MAG: hypothetical protein PVH62_00245 [Anaerolineae bacterium]|jgi:hypothetical protein